MLEVNVNALVGAAPSPGGSGKSDISKRDRTTRNCLYNIGILGIRFIGSNDFQLLETSRLLARFQLSLSTETFP
jgi:hypothetical protein